MYENPLLPNRKLQELYALMQRLRGSARREPDLRGLEGMLAASLMHVEPGDFVRSLPGLKSPAIFAAERTTVFEKGVLPSVAAELPRSQALTVATGVALGLKLGKDTRVAVYFAQAGSHEDPGWTDALAYAATVRVPLIVLVADPQTRRARKISTSALTAARMNKLASRLKLPVLSVDGTDAVAVYRCMQESVLRARTLGSTAVIWCSLAATAAAAQDPLTHMRQYLAVRKLLPARA